MIGQVLNGTYRLTDLLGSGGYADVFLARDLRTNTVVAIKLLRQQVSQNPDIAARFEREATLARRLQTPYIARVLDAGQDGSPYIVMELVQGLTVTELLRRHGPFPVDEAVEILDQLLRALGSAHALGIIHRDIKPQNLMVDSEHRLKVLDFGVARVAGAGPMTQSGHLLGTPEYMASEQIEGRPIDHRTDLYAAGAVLYQLLSGRPPFLRYSGADVWDLIRRVQRDLPPPLRQLRPEVPLPIAAVVERAMAKDPAQRFQSAADMRQALAVAAGTEPPPARTPSGALPGTPPGTPAPPEVTQVMPVPGAAIQPPSPPPPQQTRPTPPGTSTPGRPQPPPTPSQSPQPGRPGAYPPPPTPNQQFGAVPRPPGTGQGAGPSGGTQRSGMPAWQIVAFVVGAVVLVILGVAVGRLVPWLGGAAPTPTPTRAATPAAALTPAATTPAPGSQLAAPKAPTGASPTGSTPSPVAAPRPTNAPGVLLADNFENAEIGQLPRVSARPTDYVFAYDKGEYVISKINAALPAAPIVFLPGAYENTVIAVDVRIMGDVPSRYAFVVCRDQSSGGQAKQYRASIVPDGRRVILSRWDDGTQRVLSEARDDAAINAGNAVNRLELRCEGAKVSAAVNGKTLVSADDTTLNRGEQGVGAGTFAGMDGTLEARFDNLEIRTP